MFDCKTVDKVRRIATDLCKTTKVTYQTLAFWGKVQPRTGYEGPEVEEVHFYSCFNLGLRWGGWSTSRPVHFTPERPGAHCIGGWFGSRAGLDRYRKSRLHLESIPRPSSP